MNQRNDSSQEWINKLYIDMAEETVARRKMLTKPTLFGRARGFLSSKLSRERGDMGNGPSYYIASSSPQTRETVRAGGEDILGAKFLPREFTAEDVRGIIVTHFRREPTVDTVELYELQDTVPLARWCVASGEDESFGIETPLAADVINFARDEYARRH